MRSRSARPGRRRAHKASAPHWLVRRIARDRAAHAERQLARALSAAMRKSAREFVSYSDAIMPVFHIPDVQNIANAFARHRLDLHMPIPPSPPDDMVDAVMSIEVGRWQGFTFITDGSPVDVEQLPPDTPITVSFVADDPAPPPTYYELRQWLADCASASRMRAVAPIVLTSTDAD